MLRTSRTPTRSLAARLVGSATARGTHGAEPPPGFTGSSAAARDRLGHVAIEVDDAKAACEAVRAKGGKVTRKAGPVKGGTTVIAFVQDPDGYKIELIQR